MTKTLIDMVISFIYKNKKNKIHYITTFISKNLSSVIYLIKMTVVSKFRKIEEIKKNI